MEHRSVRRSWIFPDAGDVLKPSRLGTPHISNGGDTPRLEPPPEGKDAAACVFAITSVLLVTR